MHYQIHGLRSAFDACREGPGFKGVKEYDPGTHGGRICGAVNALKFQRPTTCYTTPLPPPGRQATDPLSRSAQTPINIQEAFKLFLPQHRRPCHPVITANVDWIGAQISRYNNNTSNCPREFPYPSSTLVHRWREVTETRWRHVKQMANGIGGRVEWHTARRDQCEEEKEGTWLLEEWVDSRMGCVAQSHGWWRLARESLRELERESGRMMEDGRKGQPTI
ncbi:hypothetical protein C8R45DRAFT_939627 [Mycena sanguinolenta]|nr:hypothetical protein C8R45DRAFT_939627 [Mycena sanguinolenta]